MQRVVLRPPVIAYLGRLSEMQNLKAHTRPTESEFTFSQDPQVVFMQWNFKKHWLGQLLDSKDENSGKSSGGFRVGLKIVSLKKINCHNFY